MGNVPRKIARKRRTANKGCFEKGNPDGRANNGRPKGAKNRLPATLKEAILDAMTILGSDGKGKDALVGYFVDICKDKVLGTRLAERILPMQLTGPGDGPVQVFSIPTHMIKDLSTPQLEALEALFSKLNKSAPLLIEHQPKGDAAKYAEEIGATKH